MQLMDSCTEVTLIHLLREAPIRTQNRLLLRTSGDRGSWGEGSGSAGRKDKGGDDLHGLDA